VSGCNRSAPATNNAANEVTDNGGLEAPGNDASAMESVANQPVTPPPAETNSAATNTAAPAPPPPTTPNVESNVAGM
jgi:hypothetical protein